MAIDSTDSTAEFRKDQSWLYDTKAGEYLRRTVVTVVGGFVSLYILFPLYWIIVTALKTTSEIQQIPPTIFPQNLSLQGFRLVIESSVERAGYTSFFENVLGWQIS
jgi:multiple sugar transport system permease protein